MKRVFRTAYAFSIFALPSAQTLQSQLGVVVSHSAPTYGVAAYFTDDGGPSASEICSHSIGLDYSCNAFQSAIQTSIALALQELQTDTNIQSAVAVGGPELSNAVSMQKRASATVKNLLDFKNLTFQDVAMLRKRDTEHRNGVVVYGVGSVERKYDLKLHATSGGFGEVTVMPHQVRKRSETYRIDPDAAPDVTVGANSPGFKLTFMNYAHNVINGSLSLSVLHSLAESMAQDWADRAKNDSKASRYFGVYGQSNLMITALEIIPEIRGYGVNRENPHEFCGPLDAFACLDAACVDRVCRQAAKHRECLPLQSYSYAPTPSRPICATNTMQDLSTTSSNGPSAQSADATTSSAPEDHKTADVSSPTDSDTPSYNINPPVPGAEQVGGGGYAAVSSTQSSPCELGAS